MDGFTLQEAFELINRKVLLNDEFGFVCGLLTLNSGVEVVIRFTDGLKQFTKAEFMKSVQLMVNA